MAKVDFRFYGLEMKTPHVILSDFEVFNHCWINIFSALFIQPTS